MAGAMCLAKCDICNADFAVRVTLTRHITKDCNCNCNICTKRISIITQAEGSRFLSQILIPPNMTGFWIYDQKFRAFSFEKKILW